MARAQSLLGIEVPTSVVADKTASDLLKNLNHDTCADKLKCLREIKASDIALQSLLLTNPENFLHRSFRFGVNIDNLEIIEGFYDNVDRENRFGDKPVMMGFSAYDALRSSSNFWLRPCATLCKRTFLQQVDHELKASERQFKLVA